MSPYRLSCCIGYMYKYQQVTHTHTPTENNTPDTDTHTHTTRTNPQTNITHKHLTTLEGGATAICTNACV